MRGEGTLQWGSLLRTARATVGVLLVTGLALIVPDQTRDMLEGLWDSARGHWPAIAFHGALFFLAFSAWHWSRAVLSARFEVPDQEADRHDPRWLTTRTGETADPAVLQAVPRALFLGAAGLGLVAAWRSQAWWHMAVILAWGLGGFVLLVYRLPLQRTLLGREDLTFALRPAESLPGWLRACTPRLRLLLTHAPLGPWLAAGLLAAAMLAFLAGGVETFVPVPRGWIGLASALAWAFPGPSATLLCLGLAIAPLTWLTFEADRIHMVGRVFGVPFRFRRPPLLATLALVVLLVPWAINLHGVRAVSPRPGDLAPDQRQHLKAFLKAWARRCPGAGPLQPVVVAVSGGASRAGLWGARVLMAVDDAARRAGTGVFAVSSVSGGSVGAAAYVAWLAGQPDLLPCATLKGSAALSSQVMRDAIGADALGPLLAGAMFGDIPRALLGIPAYLARRAAALAGLGDADARGGDRAEALERAFERNWRSALAVAGAPGTRAIRFDQPFLSLAYKDGDVRGGLPIWIANGTDQQRGERLLTIPFVFDPGMPWPFSGARDVLTALGGDVPISTAIDNTARFPFLSPAGELTPVRQKDKRDAMQIIDGGYFDNEGMQTAFELALWLEGQRADERDIRPILIQATADADGIVRERDIVRCDVSFRDDPAAIAGQPRGLQVLAPLLGLYDVRSGHTGVELRTVLQHYCPSVTTPRFFHFYLYKDYGTNTDVPLNWILSNTMVEYIWDNAMREGCNEHELARLSHALDPSRADPVPDCRPLPAKPS